MNEFHLQIVTPDGTIFDGMAESLLVKCDMGDVEILAGHADFLSSVAIGRARIRAGGNSRVASCAGGFLTVSDGEAKLVATTFEFADEIDVVRAEKAKEEAERRLHDSTDALEIERAKFKISRALNRIKVAENIK